MNHHEIQTATFYLPWPDRKLSPNARVHWATLARAKKSAKEAAYHVVRVTGTPTISADSIIVRYSFYPPSRRGYDMDNLIASMKAAADGIAMAIGVDDSKWKIEINPKGPVEKHGMVKVELEWEPKGKAV